MQSPDRQQDVEAERLRLELRLAHLDGQEMAQNTFIGFSRYVWPEAIISSHHEIMASAFDRIAAGTLKRLIVNMPPRHRFRRNTPVLTTKGWKTIETVEKGDYVFAPNGDPVLVTGKSDIYHEKLYEVETTDGQVVECDGEHLWTCSFSTRGHLYFDASFKTLNTKELFAKGKPKRGGPYLPDWEAVKFPDANLPIDPWLLGVWLGDGASSTGSIGCSFADKEEMKARVEACGYEVTDNPKYQRFNVLGLLVQLRELGVLDNKHIPDCYFAASIAQREALLQGLIDTDGSVGRNGRVTFHQTDRCLCEQVQSLVCSLGVKCRITLRQTKDNHLVKNSKVSYRLNFRHPRAALLARKARRLGEHSKLSGRSLTVRETERFGDVQCIEVANADGLFLAGSGFVVSHNTKSEFASYLLPAYLMGRKPQTKIIQATHTGELAVRFGRKVRNLMDLDRYKEVFSGVALKADSKAAGRWDTDAGGEYFAVGVGGAMTGRGADMLIIDDPHSEQDAQSALALENAWEWYTSGPRTRLQPGGAIVIVMCMTGDTPVLMADGVEKPLSELRRGDMVATFDKGRLRTAKVNNWKSSGVDTIYKIRTQSGKILRANARHPFLVMNEGVLEWTRLTQLSVGDELVSLKDAIDPRVLKQSPVSVAPAKPQIATIGKTQTLRDAKLVTTVSGRAKRALQKIAAIPSVVVACVPSITIKSISRLNRQKQPANTGLKAGTALLLSSMTQWCSNAVTDVMSVVSRLQSEIHALTGTGSCVLTTATTQGEYEGYSATTVTSQLGTERRPLYLNELHRISDFTTDPIASITPDGNEEVFDVEIDRTENFIANGVVSHNTRWGTKDLTARLLKAQSTNNADQWEVIEFPAVFDEGEENERALWPSFWKLEELRAVRASMSLQKWNAMYQQRPTADEGAILKREWWKLWEHDHLPDVEYIIQSYDTAYSKKETADYSVITTWGVFFPTEDSGPNIMLMDVRKGRWDFPDLKRQAKEQYDYWQPDNVLIEAKATGTTLQQELRRMGIPVTMYSPGGRRAGQDKVSRANSVAPILESGMVWATDDDWAQDLIEECAAFPNGDNDDQVDSTTQALTRFRAGNFISLHTDQDDEPRTEGLVPEYY